MERAPLHPLQDVPDGGRAFFSIARDGTRIRSALWGGGDKGTALIFPGRTEYIEKYGRMVARLQARGLNVVVIDWRGQGLSDRPDSRRDRGYVENFGEFQDDIESVLAVPEIAALNGPRYMFAHSMGGCIGLRSLVNGMDFAGAVFSAPMWGLPGPKGAGHVLSTVNFFGKPFGAHKSLVPGTKPTFYVQVAEFEGNELTTDADHYAMFRTQLNANPELGLGGPTMHWAAEALKEMAALKVATAPKTPMLVFLGGEEVVIDSTAITSRMSSLPNGHLEVLPNVRHEIWMETPNTQKHVWDLTDDFLKF